LFDAYGEGFGRAKPVHQEYLFGRRGFVDEALLVQYLDGGLLVAYGEGFGRAKPVQQEYLFGCRFH